MTRRTKDSGELYSVAAAGAGFRHALCQQELFRKALLDWFDNHARGLPWRTNPRDPYVVWVSEVMLQQTRVAAVVPYFERFMRRFPTVRALAQAPVDDVLSAWSGLGYYRRARLLHQAAQQIEQRFDGVLPHRPEELQQLAGVGPYTAAAVASMAHGHDIAVVDGNVIRVIARLLAYREPVDTSAATRVIRSVAQTLLDPQQPGKFNEALMELGALQCTPWAPDCSYCPVVDWCEAHRNNLASELPVLSEKKKPILLKLSAFVVESSLGWLLYQRREQGLFGGMWEPPMVLSGSDEQRWWVEQLTRWSGAKPRARQASVRHVLSHRVMHVRVLRCECDGEPRGDMPQTRDYLQARWVNEDELESVATSSLVRKILDHS